MLAMPKSSLILSKTLLLMSTSLSQIPKSTKFRRKGNMLPWAENKLQIHRIISTWKGLTVINYVLPDCLFQHVLTSIMRWKLSELPIISLCKHVNTDHFLDVGYFRKFRLFPTCFEILMLDIFGSSKNFQCVLEISIISGANMLTLTFLTVPLFFNATSEQT